jgi:hypothetical protein
MHGAEAGLAGALALAERASSRAHRAAALCNLDPVQFKGKATSVPVLALGTGKPGL